MSLQHDPSTPPTPPADTMRATLGGGCFWCLDAVFRMVRGVTSVRSGFSGGRMPNPSYRQVVTGATGHAEVVQVEFDPTVIPYRTVLEIFFSIHDPTTKDRQGADRGPQYRSIILTHDAEQDRIARATIAELDAEGVWADPIVTEVAAFDAFWPAEEYHEDFYRRNPAQPYCRVVIDPKVAKFRARHADWLAS